MVEDVVQQLQEEFPKIAVASLASRFLIEYAATEPPNVFRPISLSSYDEMRALSNHIINFGMLSDAVRYELSDIKLAILMSGRLGRTQGKYEGATASHTHTLVLPHAHALARPLEPKLCHPEMGLRLGSS